MTPRAGAQSPLLCARPRPTPWRWRRSGAGWIPPRVSASRAFRRPSFRSTAWEFPFDLSAAADQPSNPRHDVDLDQKPPLRRLLSGQDHFRGCDPHGCEKMSEPVHSMSAQDATPAEVVAFPAAAAKKPRRRWARKGPIAIVIVLIALAAGGAVYWATGSGTNIRYATTPVNHGPVARTVTATGTVNPVL